MIDEARFASTLYQPTEGLPEFFQMSSSVLSQMKVKFSILDSAISVSCNKKEIKMEFQVLMDLVSKALLVNAGSFDAKTRENFLVMSAITSGIEINWYNMLFTVLVDMITKSTTGFVVHISKIFNIIDLLVSTAQNWTQTKMLDILFFSPILMSPPLLLLRKILVRHKPLQLRRHPRESWSWPVILNRPLLKDLLFILASFPPRRSQEPSRWKHQRRRHHLLNFSPPSAKPPPVEAIPVIQVFSHNNQLKPYPYQQFYLLKALSLML